MNVSAYFFSLPVLIAMAIAAWVISVPLRNVSFVDSLWSLFILAVAGVAAAAAWPLGERGGLVLALATTWALRLSGHIAIRNHGQGEDSRYRDIRENNQPKFWLKSLYIVFGLQALLAWVVAAPLAAAVTQGDSWGYLDIAACLLWTVGFLYEAVADYQLSSFRGDPANEGKVLRSGLWRHTRHPNYFGEFCIWWAFWLFALSAGAWWTIVSPLLMSVLLLRVSGVRLLESTISERRPAYAEYQRQTNDFFPGPRRPAGTGVNA